MMQGVGGRLGAFYGIIAWGSIDPRTGGLLARLCAGLLRHIATWGGFPQTISGNSIHLAVRDRQAYQVLVKNISVCDMY
jgi:hypothetical protein